MARKFVPREEVTLYKGVKVKIAHAPGGDRFMFLANSEVLKNRPGFINMKGWDVYSAPYETLEEAEAAIDGILSRHPIHTRIHQSRGFEK